MTRHKKTVSIISVHRNRKVQKYDKAIRFYLEYICSTNMKCTSKSSLFCTYYQKVSVFYTRKTLGQHNSYERTKKNTGPEKHSSKLLSPQEMRHSNILHVSYWCQHIYQNILICTNVPQKKKLQRMDFSFQQFWDLCTTAQVT